MDLSLGARLRLQRERQQVALAAIAAETKIKLSLLEALERDDVSHWPEGIFRRAYVRAYARAIGLEPDAVVREFVTVHPDSVEVLPAGSVAWPNSDCESVSPQSVTRLRRVVSAAIAAVPTFLQRAQSSGPTIASASAAGRNCPDEDTIEDKPIWPEPHLPSTALRDRPIEGDPIRPELSLSVAAPLCTRLGRGLNVCEVAPVLEDAARILDAVGLMVWAWDARATALRLSLAHGYSDAVPARLPTVPRDAENAVAAAFRSADVCVVNGGNGLTGAVVVPLMAPRGCVGVLALEFRHGGEQRESVRAFASILAAQLVTLLGSSPLAEAVSA